MSCPYYRPSSEKLVLRESNATWWILHHARANPDTAVRGSYRAEDGFLYLTVPKSDVGAEGSGTLTVRRLFRRVRGTVQLDDWLGSQDGSGRWRARPESPPPFERPLVRVGGPSYPVGPLDLSSFKCGAASGFPELDSTD